METTCLIYDFVLYFSTRFDIRKFDGECQRNRYFSTFSIKDHNNIKQKVYCKMKKKRNNFFSFGRFGTISVIFDKTHPETKYMHILVCFQHVKITLIVVKAE